MERQEKRFAASEKNLAMMKIQNQRNITGASNPFPMGGMTPFSTASGQIQYKAAGGFSQGGGNNQMDLLFNRKVIKPIKGGAGGATPGSSRRQQRENSSGRTSLSNQMNFEQFMQNQQPFNGNRNRPSVGARASVGALDRSPIRAGGAPPLVKPKEQ